MAGWLLPHHAISNISSSPIKSNSLIFLFMSNANTLVEISGPLCVLLWMSLGAAVNLLNYTWVRLLLGCGAHHRHSTVVKPKHLIL